MRLRELLIVITASVTGCTTQVPKEAPKGCGTPPEDSRDYARWEAKQKAAGCDKSQTSSTSRP
jgi:hypothetical protein